MSKYDITDDMNQWEYAIYNMLQRQKEMGIIPTTKPTAATPEEQIEESLKNPYESQAETTPKPRADNSSKNPYAQPENPYAPSAKSPYKYDYGTKPRPEPAEEVIEEEEEERDDDPDCLHMDINKKMDLLLTKAKDHLRRKDAEDMIEHLYLDIYGNITIGVGKVINDEETFMSVNFMINGRPATKAEKRAAYKRFKELQEQGEYGESIKADKYKTKSPLRVTRQTMEDLLDRHVRNDIRRLRSGMPEFESLPLPLQEVLVDIRYNSGAITVDNWKYLREGISEKNLTKIMANIRRGGLHPDRLKWAQGKIKSIKNWGYWKD